MFFVFLLLRIPVSTFGFLDTKDMQKVSKKENAWYYVHIFNRSKFEDFTKMNEFNQNLTFPIAKDTYTCLINHTTAEKLSKDHDFWIKKIPSKHKIIKSETGYYSTLCPKTCKLPGHIITRTDYYAVIKYDGPPEKLSKISCARIFFPYHNSIELHARYHRGITHNYTYATEFDPTHEYYSKSRLSEKNATGKGQCIAVVDTGVDPSSMWFQRLSLAQDPKILSVFPLGDEEDEFEGHGTFVAGIAAGKAYCSEYAKSFNGVAEDAKILSVDIKNQKTGNLAFPEDLLDLYEPCLQLHCPITLNAWTSDDPLMATALDIIAFEHPDLLMIFPAVPDKNQKFKTPANAKNVLSVGSSFGHPGTMALFSTNTPVNVFNNISNDMAFGYTDSHGSPLLNSTYTKERELIEYTIGNGKGEIGIIKHKNQSLTQFKDSAAILVFHQENLYGHVDVPVIRLPPLKSEKFHEGEIITILASPSTDEGPTPFTRVDNRNGVFDPTIPQYAKPELIAPGGPMFGPKAGSDKCGLDGLTLKEGPSVSAAVVAGDAAIVRQFIQEHVLIGHNNISAAAIRGTLAVISHDLYGDRTNGPFPGAGFGTPQIEELFDKNKKLNIFQNRTIYSDTRQDFCFETVDNGVLRVALVWNDYPRDPLSNELLTQPLHLSVATNDNPYNQVLANNEGDDTPTLDMYNTVQVATLDVKRSARVRIAVTASSFAVPKPAMYSLVILGPTNPLKDISCNGYFTSGNCARGCEGRGSICGHNKVCTCGYDRGGDFCSFKPDKIHSGTSHKLSFTKRYEWRFLKLLPDQWHEGSTLTVHLDDADFSRVGFFVNAGTMPKWDDFMCSEGYCPWADVNHENHTYTFKYENWEFISKQHMFAFGFYAKTKLPYSFKIRFESN